MMVTKSGGLETIFFADAVLFDMPRSCVDDIRQDGTLTEAEAAWSKVAQDLAQVPANVIAATHGKRAVDNLAQFKPHIKAHEMDGEVQAASSTPQSSFSSSDEEAAPRRPSFMTRVSSHLTLIESHHNAMVEEAVYEDDDAWRSNLAKQHEFEAWHIEACPVDCWVRILPGVKKLMGSLPEGRYAVATSGAKTYVYGCMTRVGISPPPVTITADDKRLKAGKPASDPFLLAAKELGFDARRCVVFKDSPSGIKAGVASGATVIAVCMSLERSKIESCGRTLYR
ncbi:HAD-like protein [Lentinus tigrinus ALCF2SS1-7]|uniref:HAD-like protein n=1 Tax=Lentinus tigrinus ALCF2SS1-7 TaxID=1328758 RepID=UPI0011663AE3|nr:HAD-like protein [Lentinus tigrinus ALCF2SS1-7]